MGNIAINKGDVCNFFDASQAKSQKNDLYKAFFPLKNYDKTLLLLACLGAIMRHKFVRLTRNWQ